MILLLVFQISNNPPTSSPIDLAGPESIKIFDLPSLIMTSNYSSHNAFPYLSLYSISNILGIRIIFDLYYKKMKILIMGLPGSGKTYLTERLQPLLKAAWYNADKIREMANDWDFSDNGRKRQSMRMRAIADYEKSCGRYVLCDFVCPTKETRLIFNADITIWMDTIEEGRFEDTNKIL